MKTRREFLKKGALTLGAATIASNFAFPAERKDKNNGKIEIQQNEIILFQGDSITDAGRKRDETRPNDTGALGHGYAMLAAAALLNTYAHKDIQIYNKGISGNRVPDLISRWDADAVQLKPTVLSILIGVNDFWRTIDRGAQNTPQQYKQQYQKLLDITLNKLPNVKLIIGEPFAVKNVKHVTDAWYPDFLGYQKAAKEIAKEYNAIFLPYQSVFDRAESRSTGKYWTTDGVHTSLAGAQLMAEAWLSLLK